ncbi:MAG: glycosyltransferase family 4 protein [Candidatus Brocadiaceae bacterium]|nr:glycosyltransferase family 4 protein [Candidatus Brocadiaceae bacterium]
MKKAKVLLLTDACTVGGAEMHLLSLATHLSREKYDLTLAYLTERPDDARSLKEDFIKTGIRVIDLQARGKLDPLPILKLRKLIADYRFDLIHCHLFQAELYGRLAMVLNNGPIFITTYHNTEEFLLNPFWAWVAKYTTQKANQVIVISDAVGCYLREKVGLNKEKIKRIYYGLDTKNNIDEPVENIRIRYAVREDSPIVGMLGRYVPQKGQKFLLEAMVEVLKHFPEAKLFLAGHAGKRMRHHLEEYARTLHIEDSVIISDFRADVFNLMNQFDIFALSSLWEGFGLVLLEAMSAGRPIVATNVGPIPEVVVDGETGFLVPPKNPALLAEKLIYLLKNKALAQKMGEAGRERWKRHFTINSMIQETEAVYDYWLNKKRAQDESTIHIGK